MNYNKYLALLENFLPHLEVNNCGDATKFVVCDPSKKYLNFQVVDGGASLVSDMKKNPKLLVLIINDEGRSCSEGELRIQLSARTSYISHNLNWPVVK